MWRARGARDRGFCSVRLMSGYTGLPPIVDSFLSSGIFRNAVCLFINKQHAKILAKEGAEKDFRNLSDLQKESIRSALPRQESTVLKLIKASLVRLAEYNQLYFTSEEQFSKANQNSEYRDIPLGVLITLPSTHPIIRRKNNNHTNTVENTIHGCRRIADFHLALNQTAFKWVQLLLEVLYPNDPFAMSYSNARTKHIMLNRARTELKNEMSQPEHLLHEQYVHSLALFNKVEASVSGSLSRTPSLLSPPLPLRLSIPPPPRDSLSYLALLPWLVMRPLLPTVTGPLLLHCSVWQQLLI